MHDASPDTTRRRRRALLIVSGVLLAALGWMLRTDDSQAGTPHRGEPRSEGVLAVVDGQPVTEQEVQTAAAEELDKLELQRLQQEVQYKSGKHQLLKTTLERLVQDRLIAREARSRGITPAELLTTEVAAKLGDPDDAEIRAFYDERVAQGQRLPPIEQVRDQIAQFLRQQQEQTVRAALVTTLETRYGVERFVEELRFDVVATGHPGKGPSDAAVTIVEFSDFECPFCSRVVPTLEKISETYGDDVRVVFRQFPLGIHASAQKAAEAALCAGEQDKFWPMHDAMFADQRNLGVASLKTKAASLGLDSTRFDRCLDGGEMAAQVKEDLRAGAAAGVTGTPAMFINGRFLSGAQPYEAIARVIDEELGRG